MGPGPLPEPESVVGSCGGSAMSPGSASLGGPGGGLDAIAGLAAVAQATSAAAGVSVRRVADTWCRLRLNIAASGTGTEVGTSLREGDASNQPPEGWFRPSLG